MLLSLPFSWHLNCYNLWQFNAEVLVDKPVPAFVSFEFRKAPGGFAEFEREDKADTQLESMSKDLLM